MLLNRQQLRDTSTVNYYRKRIYYLYNNFGNQHLIEYNDSIRITTPKMFILNGANLNNLNLNEETLNNLKYEGQKRINIIIREIISQINKEI